MKAIHMAFDHDKLMGVARQFARDHKIELTPGYHRVEERERQAYRQLSLHEKAQAETFGIGREEHRAFVTELWKGRDTPQAFLQALEYHGYILAECKRPFVLVDIHGPTNSLPKLIDGKAVTQKGVAQFLGEAGSKENLPNVEEAKALALQHRQALKEQCVAEGHAEKRDQLSASQEARRAELDVDAETLKARQESDRSEQSVTHRAEANDHRDAHVARVALIEAQREATRPTGLAAFLSKASDIDLIRTKIRTYRDRKRAATHRGAPGRCWKVCAGADRSIQAPSRCSHHWVTSKDGRSVANF
ncbi:MAG: hypothetical protein AAF501_03220 [Pseudomonadota bacterium]